MGQPTPTNIYQVELLHLLDLNKICSCSFKSLSRCRILSGDESMEVSGDISGGDVRRQRPGAGFSGAELEEKVVLVRGQVIQSCSLGQPLPSPSACQGEQTVTGGRVTHPYPPSPTPPVSVSLDKVRAHSTVF